MCHPSEYVDPEALPGAARREIALDVPGGETLPARVCVPDGTLRGALVIVTDIFGANAFYRTLADRLAQSGIATMLPDIFFREGRLREPTRELAYERRALLDDERALGELGLACDWLRQHAQISEGRVGTLGFCLGGNLVLHLATRRDDLATVAYYAFPAGLSAPKAAGPPNDIADQLAGPILAFWGDRDEKVGMANVATFEQRVRDAGRDYEQHVYSGCEHGFLAGLDDPEHGAHAAAADSWQRSLAFLSRHLGASKSGSLR